MPAVPLTEEQIEDGLHSPFKLGPLQFTFSLPTGASFWETTAGNYDASNQQPTTGYSLLSAAQANNFRAALSSWDALIAPNFTEVVDDGTSHGEVRIAFTSFNMGGSTAGYAFQGSNQTPTSIVGDIWLNSNSTGASFDSGTNDFSTLIHEIGHVLGLKHPFEPTVIPAEYETTRYTVMSYTDAGRLVTFGGGGGSITSSSVAVATATPMVLDIAAVQSLYGADPTTNAGDWTYVFNETDAFLGSIYDAGGVDTFDLSGISRPNIVDLTPGAYSSIAYYSVEAQAAYWKQFYNAGLHAFIDNALAQPGTYTWTDNVGIAFSTTIENVIGGSGNDTITGNAVTNLFNLRAGGNDTVNAGAGDDGIYFGASLTALDSVDGGDGTNDQLGLQGAYAGFTLAAGHLVNVEVLALLPGNDTRFGDIAGNLYSYDITTIDANVGAGQMLAVNWNTLRVGENVTFNGSAETDGSFLTYGGLGVDTITGGAQSDGFYFGVDNRWDVSDAVTGGAGTDDQLGLQGLYAGAGAIIFGAGQLIGIETIALLTGGDTRFGTPAGVGYSYHLTMNDGNVAAGQTMIVNANTLAAAGGGLVADETLTFVGSAETDGRFVVYGGAGADTIHGGAGNDALYGRGGADALIGNGGADTYVYLSVSDSTPSAPDFIGNFPVGDIIDLSRIDAISGGGDDAFTFIGTAAFSNTAGELRYVLQPGPYLIEGDVNGDGIADLRIQVDPNHALTANDFVL